MTHVLVKQLPAIRLGAWNRVEIVGGGTKKEMTELKKVMDKRVKSYRLYVRKIK